MKRTDITELFPDAPKEAIDKLMGINGADVNAAKAEVEGLRQQLEEAKNNKQSEELQEKINQLTQELDGMKAAETIRVMRTKVASDKRVPVHLLTGDTEEACAKQADEILAFAQPSGYPQVRDGGEIHNPPQRSTRDKFADWAKDNF